MGEEREKGKMVALHKTQNYLCFHADITSAFARSPVLHPGSFAESAIITMARVRKPRNNLFHSGRSKKSDWGESATVKSTELHAGRSERHEGVPRVMKKTIARFIPRADANARRGERAGNFFPGLWRRRERRIRRESFDSARNMR